MTALTPAQQELLRRRLAGDAGPTGQVGVSRGSGIRDLPVSYGQERLVFLDRLDDIGSAYTIPVAWRLAGPLDREQLDTAFQALVERHEALRTRFIVADGVVRQEIVAGWPGGRASTGGTRTTPPRPPRRPDR